MAFKNLNKKGELNAKTLVILLILFAGIVGLGYAIITDMSDSYAVENMTDEEFEENYDVLSDMSPDVYQMQTAVTSEEGTQSVSAYDILFTSTFTITDLVFGSVTIVNNLITNFAEDFGIPSVIANKIGAILLLIIIASLVFVVLNAVRGTDKL